MDHVTSSLQACQWFPDIPAQIQVGAWSSKSNKGLSDTPGLLPHAPPFSLCSPHLRASHLPCPLPRQPFSHPYLTLSLSSPRHLPKAIIPQGLCPDPGSALHSHHSVTLLPLPMYFCSLSCMCIILSAHWSGQPHLCCSLRDFPGGSDGKESACNAGDQGSMV